MRLLRPVFAALAALALLAAAAVSPSAQAATRSSAEARSKAAKAATKAPAAARPAKAASSSRKAVSPKSRAASARSSTSVRSARSARATRVAYVPRRAAILVPARPSFGQLSGLHETIDPLDLKSSVAFVMDLETNEVLLNKNSQAVLPIASITKLMTALVVTHSGLPLDEMLTISEEDVDTEKGSRSRLTVGTTLSRGEMLHLALMSSENRAAHALGRSYPGGLDRFVSAMNAKAQLIGMHDTRYVEPTGLSSSNQSSARDLALLVKTAHTVPLIRELSTSPEHEVAVGSRQLQFHTTNRLVLNPEWEIGLQKTGYISEAGQCLVMQARLAGRQLVMVLLDSAGRYSRLGDAERIRKWLTVDSPATAGATAAPHAQGTDAAPLGATSETLVALPRS
jgi:serine-type D-Ala-D-Ala endopeptidase (penicillin-binding protein 7)